MLRRPIPVLHDRLDLFSHKECSVRILLPTCGCEAIVKSSACDEEVAPLFEELGVSKSFVRALQALCDRLREEPQWSHKPQEITEAFKFKPTRNLYRAVRNERDSKEIAARSYELVRGDLANA